MFYHNSYAFVYVLDWMVSLSLIYLSCLLSTLVRIIFTVADCIWEDEQYCDSCEEHLTLQHVINMNVLHSLWTDEVFPMQCALA